MEAPLSCNAPSRLLLFELQHSSRDAVIQVLVHFCSLVPVLLNGFHCPANCHCYSYQRMVE